MQSFSEHTDLNISSKTANLLVKFGIGKNTGKQYIHNTAWLISDKILRQGVSFAVGIWIARYLGPADFGLWNYIIAICALFSAFSTLGIESIIVRELVRFPEKKDTLIGSSFYLKLFGSIIALGLSVGAVLIVDGFNYSTLCIALLTSISFLFQTTDVIDYYFQSQVQSKYVIFARLIAFLSTTAYRIILLLNGGTLLDFVGVALAEIIITSIMLCILYNRSKFIGKISGWHWDSGIAKELLKNSWPLALSSMVVMLYMRLDQVMIGALLDKKAVGVYSAAVKICELWYFIPMLICSSIYPGIIKAKEQNQPLYFKTLSWLYFSMFWLSLAIAILTALFKDQIIDFLYGDKFQGAPMILLVYIFAGIPTFLGIATSQYLMAENKTLIALYRTGLGLSINILLNLLLIPKYGPVGAAVATVLAYGLSTYSLFLFKSTRKHFVLLIRAPFSPTSLP